MKKLLSLLGTVSLTATGVSSVVACKKPEEPTPVVETKPEEPTKANFGVNKYVLDLPKVDLYLSSEVLDELNNYLKNNDVDSIVNFLANKFSLPEQTLSLFIPKVVEQLKNKDLLSYDKNNRGVIIQLDNVLTNPTITNILSQ